MPGIQIESVSTGKGHVEWKVVFPPLSRRRRGVEKQYPRLAEACVAVKGHCDRGECSDETADIVEKNCPDIEWGASRS